MESDTYQAELLFSQKYSQYSTMLYRLAMISWETLMTRRKRYRRPLSGCCTKRLPLWTQNMKNDGCCVSRSISVRIS